MIYWHIEYMKLYRYIRIFNNYVNADVKRLRICAYRFGNIFEYAYERIYLYEYIYIRMSTRVL